MKRIILSFILLSFIFISCDKDDDQTKEEQFNATVIGQGLDCGNSYLIKLNEGASGLPENSFDNIFYEINLPEEYKVEGKLIYVEFRLPNNDEYMMCTTLGIGYPAIYVTKAS